MATLNDATYSGDDLAIALRVIYRRIGELPMEVRDDVKELFAEFAAAAAIHDGERYEAARRAIEEIMNRPPMRWSLMQIPTGTGMLEQRAELVGGNIKRLRSEAGLTQEALAERSGIGQGYISRLEQGRHSPNVLTLQKLAKALGAPLEALDARARAGQSSAGAVTR